MLDTWKGSYLHKQQNPNGIFKTELLTDKLYIFPHPHFFGYRGKKLKFFTLHPWMRTKTVSVGRVFGDWNFNREDLKKFISAERFEKLNGKGLHITIIGAVELAVILFANYSQ
jgi:hypothetical protein